MFQEIHLNFLSSMTSLIERFPRHILAANFPTGSGVSPVNLKVYPLDLEGWKHLSRGIMLSVWQLPDRQASIDSFLGVLQQDMLQIIKKSHCSSNIY